MQQRRIAILTIVLTVAAVGCHDAAAPRDEPLAIRTDRLEYRAGEPVVVTTTNRTGRTVYDDHCGGEVQGYELVKEWNGSFGFTRYCIFPDPAAWRTYSVAIPDGATHVDTLSGNVDEYSGTWRVQLALRDETGAALPEARRTSNTYRIRGTWTPLPP
jgi:hypothetical protein